MSPVTRNPGGTTTTTLSKPMVCHKCAAPHFTYQLTCKRCGNYLSKDDMVGTGNNKILTIALALIMMSVAFAAAKCIHLL